MPAHARVIVGPCSTASVSPANVIMCPHYIILRPRGVQCYANVIMHPCYIILLLRPTPGQLLIHRAKSGQLQMRFAAPGLCFCPSNRRHSISLAALYKMIYVGLIVLFGQTSPTQP